MEAKRILIVEDDEELGQLLLEALKKAEYEVFLGKNSVEAFQIIDGNKIDFIYLDINLPGELNGYDILRQLKDKSSENRHIPIVMLSNLSETNEIYRAIEMGAEDYVVKANASLKDLVDLVKKIIGNAKPEDLLSL